jgi:hypothetical protein
MRIASVSAAVVVLSALGAMPGGAVVPLGCDLNKDNYIDAREARKCTERRFEQISNGRNGLGPEQFGKALPNAENPSELFKQVDQNHDGVISRDEWTSWRQQGFVTATAKSSGRLPAADYHRWVDGAYTRPTHTAGQNSQ